MPECRNRSCSSGFCHTITNGKLNLLAKKISVRGDMVIFPKTGHVYIYIPPGHGSTLATKVRMTI